jgi:transcriptional regulator with XRE-family HTH domain
MVIPSYFDNLPLHPLPRRLESLSSYVLRLAEANMIQSVHILAALLGIPAATFIRLSNYPLLSYGTISTRTNVVQENLLATTFYHFGKKFGRSTRPSALARFLKGSLGSHLRYCPACLSEASYYSLTWCFLALYGCTAHRCRLLERCGHCDASLPLFSPPLQVGVCSTCREDLSSCSADQLSEQELRQTSLRSLDLEYLLTPHPCEQENAIAKTVGRRLAMLRRAKQLFVQQVATHLSAPENQIRGIERGGTEQGAPFHIYVQYAEFLGVSLRDVFNGSYVSPAEQEESLPPKTFITLTRQPPNLARRQREGELIERLQEAIPQLEALGKPITTRTISQFVGLTRQGIEHYPVLKALWEQTTRDLHAEWEKRKQQREDDLVGRVQEAIAAIIAREQYPSQEAISKLVHMSPGGLRYYPRVRALIAESMDPLYRSRAPRNQPFTEEEVVEQVKTALAHLQSSRQFVTQQRLSDMVGLSLHRLRLYPQVATMLDRIAEENHVQRKQQAILHEQFLAEQVRKAIQQLHDRRQPVSRRAVGELIGLTPRALAKYHLVRPLLSQIVEEYRNDRPQRAKQRESELLKQVRQVIQQLQEQGRPITQKAVGQRLGLTAPALMYYPRFRKFYYKVVEENRRARRKQAQLREAVLVERVQAAILQLSKEGKLLTFQNIKRQVGMSVAGLKRYPRIKVLLQQIAEERRHA